MKSRTDGTFSSAIRSYFKEVWRGFRSLTGSFATALPYLMNVKSGDLKKEVTEQYPDPVSSRGADELPPRTRGLLFNDIERCTGCRECAIVCPTQCITVEPEPGMNPNKLWVSVFDIDFAQCIFCGICVEACEPNSLIHTKEFEGSVLDPSELVASFGRGAVSAEQRAKWEKLRKMKEDGEEA